MFNIFRKEREATGLHIKLLKNMDSYKNHCFSYQEDNLVRDILLVKKKPAVLPLPSVDQNENSNIATSVL